MRNRSRPPFGRSFLFCGQDNLSRDLTNWFTSGRFQKVVSTRHAEVEEGPALSSRRALMLDLERPKKTAPALGANWDRLSSDVMSVRYIRSSITKCARQQWFQAVSPSTMGWSPGFVRDDRQGLPSLRDHIDLYLPHTSVSAIHRPSFLPTGFFPGLA